MFLNLIKFIKYFMYLLREEQFTFYIIIIIVFLSFKYFCLPKFRLISITENSGVSKCTFFHCIWIQDILIKFSRTLDKYWLNTPEILCGRYWFKKNVTSEHWFCCVYWKGFDWQHNSVRHRLIECKEVYQLKQNGMFHRYRDMEK